MAHSVLALACPIQIRHDFEHGENDEGATPDAVIDNMTELLDILRAESGSRTALLLKCGKIRALIFDAGDILYFRPRTWSQICRVSQRTGHGNQPEPPQEKKAIEYKAYRGEISHDEYREAIVDMYGITQPELVARGKEALIDDDDNVAFFEGVPETLHALKEQGYLLGIVTDTANSISAS